MPGLNGRLGVSVGIAGLRGHGSTAEELLEAADAWRVWAKRAGGNRIAIHVEERMILKSSYYPRPSLHRLMKLALQRRYGSSKKMQVWNTEFGYWSVPPTKVDPVKQKGQAISQRTAAFYMNWAEYLSYQNPRLMSYSQYPFVDPATMCGVRAS